MFCWSLTSNIIHSLMKRYKTFHFFFQLFLYLFLFKTHEYWALLFLRNTQVLRQENLFSRPRPYAACIIFVYIYPAMTTEEDAHWS
jgi:hypothetical protein